VTFIPGAGEEAETRFIRAALRGLGTSGAGLTGAIRAVRDWDRAARLARKGAVAESVWAGVRFHGLQGEVPAGSRAVWEEAHAGALACNAELLAGAAEVQATLAARGVESIALKGTALIAAHYPDIGARHVGDLDLLLRRRDAPRAELILLEAGLREGLRTRRYGGAERPPGARDLHEEVRLETVDGIPVDLQDRLPGGARDASDVEGLFDRARTVRWQGRNLRIPSPADLAAGLCLHVFSHHVSPTPFLPRHLADLSVLVGSGAVTWEAIAERMPGGSCDPALGSSRELLENGSTSRMAVLRQVVRVRTSNWRDTFESAASGPGGRLRVVFPARGYMAMRYQVRESSPLIPLLYLWRPVRGIWSILTGR
jgi:hypothetical protein